MLQAEGEGSHWGGTEGIYGLWISTIVMLMQPDASDDPQSGIILYDSAEFTLLQERDEGGI